MLDNTTAPLRTARQVFEEVEEIAFSFKRTHKVTVNAEGSDPNDQPRWNPTPRLPLPKATRSHRRTLRAVAGWLPTMITRR